MNHEEVKKKLLQNPEVREAYEHPPLPIAVAHAVVQRRHALHLSQDDLAERLGSTQAHVWRIESGQSNLTLDSLQKLAEALHLSVEVIFKEPETRQSPTSIRISLPKIQEQISGTAFLKELARQEYR